MQSKNNQAAGFFWNMVGSACYSFSSILYLMVVTRICGAEEAGFFSLAYATAQLLLTVGRYGMRTYQATDLKSAYSFLEYGFSRILTITLMVVLGAVYSMYMFSGKCVHSIDGVDYPAKKGDLLFINCNSEHNIKCNDFVNYADILIKPEYISSSLRKRRLKPCPSYWLWHSPLRQSPLFSFPHPFIKPFCLS